MAARVLQGELMDDPGLHPDEHRHALRGLARINRVSLAARAVEGEVRCLARDLGRAVRVVDVACGSGDVGVAVARRAGGLASFTLVDVSPVALDAARTNARRAGVGVECVACDALTEKLPTCDLVACSLFLHHLTETQAVALLAAMRDAAGSGVFVSDLRRGAWGTGLAAVVPRALTRSRVVHVDALRSARAAWTCGELRSMAARAGMDGAEVRAAFPARMVLRWRRAA